MRKPVFLSCVVAVCVLIAHQGSRAGATQESDLDALPRLRLVERLRIGSNTDPVAGFSRIGQVTIGRDGLIYVFESQDMQLRVYNASGQLIRRIGRAGNGPGEFRSGPLIGVKGDTVWTAERSVVDLQHTLFNRGDGSVIATARSPAIRVPGRGTSALLLSPAYLTSDGNLLSGYPTISNTRGAPPTGIGDGDTLRIPRVLFNIRGEVLDTLAWIAEPPRDSPPRVAVTIAGERRYAPGPLSDAEISQLFVGGRFVVQRPTPRSAAAATIRVVREGIRGESLYARTFRYRPTRYSSATLDSMAARALRSTTMIIIDGAVQQPRQISVTPDVISTMRQAMRFPEFQPPVQAAFAGEDGSLWMEREYEIGPIDRWIVLDPRGNPRGLVELPPRFRLAWASGDVLWGVLPDADDVPWLVEYRLAG